MMEHRKKSFFILLLVLAVFTVGAAIFSNDKDMVYEETEETECPPSEIEQLRADIDYIAIMTGVEL